MGQKYIKYIEIIKDINVIPAGTYRVISEQDKLLEFKVGKKIIFGITLEAKEYFKPVPFTKAVKALTNTEQFVERYYDLLKSRQGKSHDPYAPYTYCILDPSLAQEMH